MKKLISLYHINTNFSSINSSQFKKLINNSYNKLLDLIEDNNYNISVEASAKSLMDLKKIDENIVNRLKYLININKCSFVASGYIQMIMPLVPYEVNKRNLELGNEIYKDYFGIKPKIFYVNEQAFSKSLIKLLGKYDKIILEYNRSNLIIKKNNYAYNVNTIQDDYNNKIDVIWNDHILFQKFQKLIYDEITENEYLKFLEKYKFPKNSYLPIYCSDVECFGFSPGRYASEPKLLNKHWERINSIYKKLESVRYTHSNLYGLEKGIDLKSYKITNIENPIIVKKQAKYNVTRWCLTGRNDLKINTFCWRLLENFKIGKIKDKKKWQSLCELWSSDSRTHITKTKWNRLIKKFKDNGLINLNLQIPKLYKFKKTKTINELNIRHKNFKIKINPKKGFSIKSLNTRKKILGFIEQGYYKSRQLDVDFFSGHSIIEYEKQRFTDISTHYRNYFFRNDLNESCYIVKKGMKNFLNYKKISIMSNSEIELENCFTKIPDSSLRTFYLTISPELFNKNNLYIKTHNGGNKFETFYFKNSNFDYGRPVSNIVSSNTVFGATNNTLILGDKKSEIIIKIKRSYSAIMPMLSYQSFSKNYLLRLFFSCCETDDTSKKKSLNFTSNISLKIKKVT